MSTTTTNGATALRFLISLLNLLSHKSSFPSIDPISGFILYGYQVFFQNNILHQSVSGIYTAQNLWFWSLVWYFGGDNHNSLLWWRQPIHLYTLVEATRTPANCSIIIIIHHFRRGILYSCMVVLTVVCESEMNIWQISVFFLGRVFSYLCWITQ